MNKKAFGTTILMGVVALFMCGAAYIYYPKIYRQASGPEKDKPLIETYETSKVRYIKIDRFDPDQNAEQKIQLSFVAGRWVIPSKNNFLASNAARVAAAVNSLKDRNILNVVSDQQEDHIKYGVVNVSDANNGVGAGTLVTLEDRNHQQIGSLIVGEPTKDQGKHYVRIPGQPQIYEVEFDANVLSTDFGAWVDGNLLRLDSDGSDLDYIQVDKYIVDAQELATSPEQSYVYRVRASRNQDGWTMSQWLPDAQQQLGDEPSIVDQPINLNTLRNVMVQLTRIQVQDVKKKRDEAAEKLANPQRNDSPTAFAPMMEKGFRQVGMNNGQHQFVSVGGRVSVRFNTGVQYDFYVGNIAGVDLTDGSKLSRFALITAELDESKLPMPTRESSATTGEGDDGGANTDANAGEETGEQEAGNQESDDDAERAYQRLVQERDQKLKAANQQTARVNQVNADWYYVVGESVVNNLFPDIDAWTDSARPQ